MATCLLSAEEGSGFLGEEPSGVVIVGPQLIRLFCRQWMDF